MSSPWLLQSDDDPLEGRRVFADWVLLPSTGNQPEPARRGDPSAWWSAKAVTYAAFVRDIAVEHRGGDDYLVRVGGRSHSVRATPQSLSRAARPGETPEETITRSFRFLLDREPPGSILSSFDLEVIAHYFPDFWSEMRGA